MFARTSDRPTTDDETTLDESMRKKSMELLNMIDDNDRIVALGKEVADRDKGAIVTLKGQVAQLSEIVKRSNDAIVVLQEKVARLSENKEQRGKIAKGKPTKKWRPKVFLYGDVVATDVYIKRCDICIVRQTWKWVDLNSILHQIKNQRLCYDVKLVLVHCGVKSLEAKDGNVRTILQNFKNLSRLIHQLHPQAKLIFSGILYHWDFKDFMVDEVNRAIEAECTKNGDIYINGNRAGVTKDHFGHQDFHLNANGLEILTNFFTEKILSQLKLFFPVAKNHTVSQ